MYDVRCKKAADALLDAGRRQYFIAEQDNRVYTRSHRVSVLHSERPSSSDFSRPECTFWMCCFERSAPKRQNKTEWLIIIFSSADKLSLYKEFIDNQKSIYTKLYKDLEPCFYGLLD